MILKNNSGNIIFQTEEISRAGIMASISWRLISLPYDFLVSDRICLSDFFFRLRKDKMYDIKQLLKRIFK